MRNVSKLRNQDVEYLNNILTFDIETYSDNITQAAYMYLYTLIDDGKVFTGRTWEEFKNLINDISMKYRTHLNRRVVIWVHYLGYEFQFIKKHFNFVELFSTGKNQIQRALTDNGIEFRCSKLLSNMSLDTLAKSINMSKYDFNYDIPRNSKTKLTEEELNYCINDAMIVYNYIYIKRGEYHGIANIPPTSTAAIRKFIKNECLYTGGKPNKTYNNYINSIKLDSELYYRFLKPNFNGAYVFCNEFYRERTIKDVYSYDIDSSYIYSMVACPEYPISNFMKVKIETIEQLNNLKLYSYIAHIKFINVRNTTGICTLKNGENVVIKGNRLDNNGYLEMADEVIAVMNNIDFEIFNDNYTYDSIEFGEVYKAYKGYLPKELQEAILKLYSLKNELKMADNKGYEYDKIKMELNGIFGMIAMRPDRPTYKYNNTTFINEIEETTREKFINDYNTKSGKFSLYQWAPFITSISRRNLIKLINKIGLYNILYSDTDSVKFVDSANINYINDINNKIDITLHKVCNERGFNYDKIHNLGKWVNDDYYTEFKMIKPKCYAGMTLNGLNATVSGCNKLGLITYLNKLSQNHPLDAFRSGLIIPAEYAQLKSHYYIDEQTTGIITDYQGNTEAMTELSSVYITGESFEINEPLEFSLLYNLLYNKDNQQDTAI